MPKKDIIRKGDKVKVINPLFVKKWGYENNLRDTYDEVMEKYSVPISKFILEVESTEQPDRLGRYREVSVRERSRFASAIAYHLVGMRMKSGSVRKLFYADEEEKDPFCLSYTYPAGAVEEVQQIKIVKIGIYKPPWSCHDYWSEDIDYKPGNLSEEKTHKLLRIGYTDYWIEAINVEKVHD